MKTDEIRESFLKFFESKDHKRVTSDTLVPTNDPSLLFTGAGMNQFKDQFLGRGNLDMKRAVTAQKCLRTGDFDNVGRTPGHHTFFEMMGNFSFGDYFKREAIVWGWEWLLEWMKVDPGKLYVSVYLDDEEAYGIWRDVVGLAPERIYRYGEHDNFWPADAPTESPAGTLCGPCSEIFYDLGPSRGCEKPDCQPACECRRYVEIWNLVFQQYEKGESVGELHPLKTQNIDTGLGLERMAAVMQGMYSNFEIDSLSQIVKKASELTRTPYGKTASQDRSLRRITDHIRSAVFAIADGVVPGNEGRRYVVRRLIRNAVLDGHDLGVKEPFLHELVGTVVQVMGGAYSEVADRQETAIGFIRGEEEAFLRTLEKGEVLYQDEVSKVGKDAKVSGSTVFKLYATFGFPWQLTAQRLRESGKDYDQEEFEREMEKHRELSTTRTADIFGYPYLQQVKQITTKTTFLGYAQTAAPAKVLALIRGQKQDAECITTFGPSEEPIQVVLDQTPFYAESGGQVGDAGEIQSVSGARLQVLDVQKAGDIFFHVARVCSGTLHVGDAVTCEVDLERRMDVARNHTATHVLHHFLHKVLGKHAEQSGSKVDRDRFSLDFTHFKAMTQEEIAQVEALANGMIIQDLPVSTDITTPSEAKQRGAMALFGEKYGEEVRLVSVGEASKELCGGTHVNRTGQIGMFKILSEESVAAGIRRIVATSGTPAYEHTQKQERILMQLKEILRVPVEELPQRIHKLTDQVKSLELEVKKARDAALSGGSGMSDVQEVNGIKILTAHVGEASQKDLLAAGDRLKSKTDVLVLGSQDKDKACLVCWVLSKEALAKGVNAGKIIQQLSLKLDGKGGGNPEMARGGGKDPSRLSEVLATASEEVKTCCE